jgi:hypothetical protein
MVISINSDLEAALTAAAQKQGLSPEDLALATLRQKFLPYSAFTSEELYD